MGWQHAKGSGERPACFNPTHATRCFSRLAALARDEEGLHLLVLQDLHGRLLGSVALRDREQRLLRLRHHRAREVVFVDRVVPNGIAQPTPNAASATSTPWA